MQPTGASQELVPPIMPAVSLPAPSNNEKKLPTPSDLVYCVNYPTPKCTESQYLVKVQATGLCREELEWPYLVHHRESGATVIGHDICGTVLSTPVEEESMEEGPKFKVGDRVIGLIGLGKNGGAADCVAAERNELAFKPPNISGEEAASMPLPALTAFQGLHEKLNIDEWLRDFGKEEGNPLRVLILGGTSNVGIAAIQLLRSKNLFQQATIWICAAILSNELEKSLRNAVDVDGVLDCSENADLSQTWAKNEWQPVTLVLDCIGGDMLEQVLDRRILHRTGAVATTVEPQSKVRHLSEKHQVGIRCLSVEPNGKQLDKFSKLIEIGDLKPNIDKVFELYEAKEAMEYLESRETQGRVVLRVNYD